MVLFAADHPVVPVDARVNRVARRLGYGVDTENVRALARSVRRALEGELPRNPEGFRRAFVYLSHHGAATCTETDPHCQVCPLRDECAEGLRRRFS